MRNSAKLILPILAALTGSYLEACGDSSGSDGERSARGGAPGSSTETRNDDLRAGGPSSNGVVPSGGAPQTGTAVGTSGDAKPSAGCGKIRSLLDGNRTIQSGDKSRTYHLKAPANYDNTRPYRLIFMFHWFYGSINAIVNPPDADHNTDAPYYGLGSLAGESTIFVVPQGLTDSGGAGWANPNNRDVTFTDDLLKAISEDLCVDTSRVFTTGFSYGGAISYKLACVRPDKFRAALVYDTGPVSGNDTSECTRPIAFFQSHGVDDQTFSYQTGLSVLDIFVRVNGCSKTVPPMSVQDGHSCTSFEGCSQGYPVRFCNFGSGENNPFNTSLKGHYPSPKDPGQSASWVPEETWSFIRQF